MMQITVTNKDLIYAFSVDMTFQQILDALVNKSKRVGYVAVEPTKVYRVIDDGTCVLMTTDELKALRLYKEIMDANDKVNTWGWVDTEELK